jgi:hypothetical protein
LKFWVVPIIGIMVAARSHQFHQNSSHPPQAPGTFSFEILKRQNVRFMKFKQALSLWFLKLLGIELRTAEKENIQTPRADHLTDPISTSLPQCGNVLATLLPLRRQTGGEFRSGVDSDNSGK